MVSGSHGGDVIICDLRMTQGINAIKMPAHQKSQAFNTLAVCSVCVCVCLCVFVCVCVCVCM